MFEPVALNASLGSFGNKKERKRKEATGKEGQQVWFLFYCLLWEFSSLFLLFSLIIKFLIVLCFLAWLDFPSLAICLISFSLSSINHCGYPLSPWLDRGYWGLFLFFFCYLLLFFFFFFSLRLMVFICERDLFGLELMVRWGLISLVSKEGFHCYWHWYFGTTYPHPMNHVPVSCRHAMKFCRVSLMSREVF